MRKMVLAAAAAVVLAFGLMAASTSIAADDPPAKSDAKAKDGDKDKIDLPPFPEAASVKQVTRSFSGTLGRCLPSLQSTA